MEEILFKKMYFLLFRRITEAIEVLERGDDSRARSILIRAQQEAEELYLEGIDEKSVQSMNQR